MAPRGIEAPHPGARPTATVWLVRVLPASASALDTGVNSVEVAEDRGNNSVPSADLAIKAHTQLKPRTWCDRFRPMRDVARHPFTKPFVLCVLGVSAVRPD